MKGKSQVVLGTAAALMLGLTGCGASFEGSGSKDAASAEQLAMRIDDPWAVQSREQVRVRATARMQTASTQVRERPWRDLSP